MKPGKRRWAALLYRHKIRNALLTYYLTPILLILFASGVFFYVMARRSLDQEFGKRLQSIALASAFQVRSYQVAALELRNPQTLTYRSVRNRFDRIQKATDVARIYIFNLADESLLDTDPNNAIGHIYERNRLNRAELEKVRSGQAAASLLFQGKDGSYYKSAYAPVKENGAVVAIVGVDGSATFFENLHFLGRRLAFFGLACVVMVVLVSIIISRKIVTPISALVTSAQRIGEGHFDEPVRLHAQNELGFLGFVMEEMRKNIVTRDRELQMMLRGIAHEVRNPLGGIELFAGMLREEVRDGSAQNAVARIEAEVNNLKTLVEEFLDFARGPSLQMSRVHVHSFFNDLRLAFQNEARAKNIEIKVTASESDHAEFDLDQMRRVFLNLLQNSIQAMPQGGLIELSATIAENQVDLSISDSGTGIEAKNLEKLFDPFFTTKEKGSGLGLSFARKIVNAHEGEILVESTPGAGTKITIVVAK